MYSYQIGPNWVIAFEHGELEGIIHKSGSNLLPVEYRGRPGIVLYATGRENIPDGAVLFVEEGETSLIKFYYTPAGRRLKRERILLIATVSPKVAIAYYPSLPEIRLW